MLRRHLLYPLSYGAKFRCICALARFTYSNGNENHLFHLALTTPRGRTDLIVATTSRASANLAQYLKYKQIISKNKFFEEAVVIETSPTEWVFVFQTNEGHLPFLQFPFYFFLPFSQPAEIYFFNSSNLIFFIIPSLLTQAHLVPN